MPRSAVACSDRPAAAGKRVGWVVSPYWIRALMSMPLPTAIQAVPRAAVADVSQRTSTLVHIAAESLWDRYENEESFFEVDRSADVSGWERYDMEDSFLSYIDLV